MQRYDKILPTQVAQEGATKQSHRQKAGIPLLTR